mmetsp:Transcript_26130/g.60338  ORF Transcript_26130/g.60338 Transcript_26130/m.60338 type:complete len:243 (+) Transcript_26130:1088-1816(+)
MCLGPPDSDDGGEGKERSRGKAEEEGPGVPRLNPRLPTAVLGVSGRLVRPANVAGGTMSLWKPRPVTGVTIWPPAVTGVTGSAGVAGMPPTKLGALVSRGMGRWRPGDTEKPREWGEEPLVGELSDCSAPFLSDMVRAAAAMAAVMERPGVTGRGAGSSVRVVATGMLKCESGRRVGVQGPTLWPSSHSVPSLRSVSAICVLTRSSSRDTARYRTVESACGAKSRIIADGSADKCDTSGEEL